MRVGPFGACIRTGATRILVDFSDNRQNDGTWCEPGDEPPPIDTDKFCLKTEVYIGISSKGIISPVFIDSPERVNGKNYSEQAKHYTYFKFFTSILNRLMNIWHECVLMLC